LELTEAQNSSEWNGLKEEGYLNEEMVRRHVSDAESQTYYLCGPPAYANSVVQTLKNLGVPSGRINFEQW
jgi:predicted ferric reductase